MSDKHKRCAWCGYHEHLSGPLQDAVVPTSQGVRYLCADQVACARRRREREQAAAAEVVAGPGAMAGWVYERDPEPEYGVPLPSTVDGWPVGGRR